MSAAQRLKEQPSSPFHAVPPSGGGVIYGPFENPNYGSTIGINLLGTKQKVCSFDCVYCDLGRTEVRMNRLKTDIEFPSVEQVKDAVTAALQKIHTSGPRVDSIIISGNGEPTLHPDFPAVIEAIVEARNAWLPGRPISLFTNGAALDTRKITDAVNLLDERVVKIDAGGEKLFKTVNAPLTRANLARVLSGIHKLKDVVVQSLFFEGTITNTSTADVDEWLELIAVIKPKAIQIQGLSRSAATEGLKRCEEDTLYAIASRLERKTSLKAIVIP
jgi:wyosine [tRNA(Phe)-imidazoG37] synthetase (radical SAM superfamily)